MADDESSPSADNPADTAGPEADRTIDLPSQRSQPESGPESVAVSEGSNGDATIPPPEGVCGPSGQRPAFTPRFPWPTGGADQAAPPDPLIGSELGGVRIVRMIAEGGMGRVYEGLQEKPRRPVAVKVIKPGLTSPELLKRFDYEAQVLGRLRHPGIAQIYTVGTHEIGGQTVPFFMME